MVLRSHLRIGSASLHTCLFSTWSGSASGRNGSSNADWAIISAIVPVVIVALIAGAFSIYRKRRQTVTQN